MRTYTIIICNIGRRCTVFCEYFVPTEFQNFLKMSAYQKKKYNISNYRKFQIIMHHAL